MKKTRGFTLIEVIIYIALFSIILTTAFLTAYNLIGSTDQLNSKNVTQEEGDFVTRKIDWALTGIDAPGTPPPTYSPTLSVTKHSGTQIDMRLNAGTGKIEIREGVGGTYLPLTTDNVKVTALQFRYITAANTPSGFEASTTINGIIFTTTKYLRR